MKIYKVGGAVRDRLLGIEPQDIDYVITGATESEMLSLGYQKVGADFPVFLHPETGDEYALARIEKRIGNSYADFEFIFDPSVSLEDDLRRRDTTINAMAEDENGVIIDPWGGQKDLQNKIIRHTSDAFKDDPTRILRVARFCAKMPEFTVAPETIEMMKEMVKNGEIDNLKPDRIWKEITKAFDTDRPSSFIKVLDELNALEIIFPEIYKMKGVPQRADYHAEGDVYVHTLMVLDEATKLSMNSSKADKLLIRMSALLHDIGKAYTSNSLLYHEDGSVKGHHHGHDGKEIVEPKIKAMSARLRMPKDIEIFCLDVATTHQKIHSIKQMSARGIAKMFNELSIRQKAGNGKENRYIDNMMISCYADAIGRKVTNKITNQIEDAPTDYEQQDLFRNYFKEYSNCSQDLQNWIKDYTVKAEKQPDGESIKSKLNTIRVGKIKRVM